MYLNRFGSGNPAWLGGKSFEEYCEVWKDKEFKLDLRQRDENRCLNPYCSSKNSSDLTIHHIDYNKKNCHPKNLITVCRSCNARANKDRKWHKFWYQAVLTKRYNYKY
jgi:5-methylcytosine-specific restriction endonuclease McrA